MSRYLITLSLSFVISLYITHTIETGFTLNNTLVYPLHIENTIRSINYFLYNISQCTF